MDPQIKSLQDYLKTSPLGISFTGASDGYMSVALKDAANKLQQVINDKLKSAPVDLQNKYKSFSIINGDKITASPDQIKALLTQIAKPEDVIEQKSLPNIKAVQETFNSNPFGLVYKGAKDGVINDELISKLKELESKITEATGANVAGKIVSGNNVITNSADLSKTFSLIKSYQDFIKVKK